MSEMQVTAEPGVPQVVVTRTFDAPRELVYRAFTEPALLVQWLGPRKYTMTIERFEPRDGGTWRVRPRRRRWQRVRVPRGLPR